MSDVVFPTPVWSHIDAALGEAGELDARIRETRGFDRATRRSLAWSLAGAAAFGAALGVYAHSTAQLRLPALKVPLLLLGTAGLCFPAFHVLQRLRAPRPLAVTQS